jgi:dTMP kinase
MQSASDISLAGRFIAFEGPDGSGKTTLCRRFVEFARAHSVQVCEVRDPGGTAIGDQIRSILLDPANGSLDRACELLLFMASRAQLVHERIRPALQRGELVVADRFIASTLVYQGAAGGLGPTDIDAVAAVAIGDLRPDFYIVLDAEDQVLSERLTRKTGSGAAAVPKRVAADRIEERGIAFRTRVRRGYHDLCAADPGRYVLVDASGDADAVWHRAMDAVRIRLASLPPTNAR